jgi:hypothetical protein
MCRVWSFRGDCLLSQVYHLILYKSQPLQFPSLNEFFSSIALLIISVYSIPFDPLQLPPNEILHLFLAIFVPLFLLYASGAASFVLCTLSSFVTYTAPPPQKLNIIRASRIRYMVA